MNEFMDHRCTGRTWNMYKKIFYSTGECAVITLPNHVRFEMDNFVFFLQEIGVTNYKKKLAEPQVTFSGEKRVFFFSSENPVYVEGARMVRGFHGEIFHTHDYLEWKFGAEIAEWLSYLPDDAQRRIKHPQEVGYDRRF